MGSQISSTGGLSWSRAPSRSSAPGARGDSKAELPGRSRQKPREHFHALLRAVLGQEEELERRKSWRGGRVGEDKELDRTKSWRGGRGALHPTPLGIFPVVAEPTQQSPGQKTPGTKARNSILGSLWGHLSRTKLAGLGAGLEPQLSTGKSSTFCGTS